MYIPPFTVSADAINLIAEISGQIERYAIRLEQEDGLRLRKVNRIKTIHSSLAIEGNTLSEDQVCDIIDGKNVVAPIKEIQEVKNAIATYELYPTLDAFKEKDLLKAHSVMMQALVDNPGHYRRGGVGVFGEKGLVHLAPPAERVPMLMSDLFAWLKQSKDHLLIRSCVFHYEFEFIHPFIDGNGRMGRYWQTMLLSRWKGIFSWIPVETIVREHQQEYYSVIAKCDAAGESTQFVEFMLQCLLEAIENYEETEEDEVTVLHDKLHDKLHNKFPELTEKAIEVLEVIHAHRNFNAAEIGKQVGLSERQVKTYITKLKQTGLIVRVGSNKTGYWKVNT